MVLNHTNSTYYQALSMALSTAMSMVSSATTITIITTP